jgi:hypothetical protein
MEFVRHFFELRAKAIPFSQAKEIDEPEKELRTETHFWTFFERVYIRRIRRLTFNASRKGIFIINVL